MSLTSASDQFPIEWLPIDLLRHESDNPRSIDPVQEDALERSIRRFGMVQPIVARREGWVIIGGHQRHRAAKRLGLLLVPTIVLDLDEDQAHVLGIGLNQIGGDFDQPLLARLVARLQERPDVDLSLTGLTAREIGGLARSLRTRTLRDQPETFDLETALAAAGRIARVQSGDVWQLGPHRIACGDATSVADVERLLAGDRAGMAFSDPPYGVDLGNHGGQGRDARRRPMLNDDLDPVAQEQFVRAWATNLLAGVRGAMYVCMSSKELPLVSRILAELGAHWSDTIIWAKDRFVLGRADYQRAYEPIWYGWPGGAERQWAGGRDQSDVWSLARPARSPLHPTTKPLALMERAISNSSTEGDLVLDLFLGSGSTLIACERTGRVCAGLELDPRYVEVTLARWEVFTGETAVREAAGAPAGTA